MCTMRLLPCTVGSKSRPLITSFELGAHHPIADRNRTSRSASLTSFPQQCADPPLEATEHCRHFTDRIENTLFDTDGRATHLLDRVMNVGGNLFVLVFNATGFCSVLLTGFPIGVLSFFDAVLCLTHKAVSLVRHNSRFLLDEIPRLVDVIGEHIGMRHGSTDFLARLGLEQITNSTANS